MRYVTILVTTVMLLGTAAAAHPHDNGSGGEAVSINRIPKREIWHCRQQ